MTLLLVLMISLVTMSNLHLGGERWQFILDADAKGYYAYLPAVFVYQDPNYGFFDLIEKEKYFIESQFYDYRVNINSGSTNKYFCGTAIMIAPFYLLAHGYALLSGFDADGYSFPYQFSVLLAALFYLILGLFLFNKFMRAYGISPISRSIVLVALAFGTHLFNYSIVEPGFSHVYSFCLFCAFLLVGHQWTRSGNARQFALLCLLLGLIAVVRPSNLLVLLSLPFLAGDVFKLWKAISKTFRAVNGLVSGVALFAAPVFIQLLLNKWSTGFYIVDTYAGEGFDLSDPHFVDVLFSYKKGLFLYTPISFLSLLGLVPLFRKNATQGFFWLLFMCTTVFVVSSWHNWWYGGSFSMRPFVEYLPFFLLLLGLALEHFKAQWKRIAMISAVFLFMVVNQVQTYQYRYYQIHFDSMTKEKYWDVFLRIDKIN